MLPEYQVDELVIKIDTEEFSHGQPPLDWVKAYQEKLYTAKEALEAMGIVYSLNPWVTIGHIDRGRHLKDSLPNIQTFVGHDGSESVECASPLCPVWRRHVVEVWRLYAETKPAVIWIEDDIRLFNHLPVRYGNFCPLSLQRFSKIVGQSVTREALVAALLQPGEPHPWRAVFFNMQAEVVCETVSMLLEAIRSKSADTRIGLMSSGPRRHCAEGRQWQPLVEALGGESNCISRPTLGNYWEESTRGLYFAKDSILLTRHCLPQAIEEQTEVENVPFSRYSKSIRFTELQIALSFAAGSSGVTLNLFDHCGTAMEAEPEFGKLLGKNKSFYRALCERSLLPGRYRGVQLLFDEDLGAKAHLSENGVWSDLMDPGDPMMELLESHGFATVYGEENIVAACGEQLRAYSDQELTALLRKGLLLDGAAAKIVVDRGFGELIGLSELSEAQCIDAIGPLSAEEFHHPGFGGAEGCFLTLTLPDLAGRPACHVPVFSGEVSLLSHLVDFDRVRRTPGLYVYENSEGGRVAVHLLDLASAYGVAFRHTNRKIQLEGVLNWLGREEAPPIQVNGGVYPIVLRKDTDTQSFLALFNLSLDSWPSFTFVLADARRPVRVEILDCNGTWVPLPEFEVKRNAGRIILSVPREAPLVSAVFLHVHWEDS